MNAAVMERVEIEPVSAMEALISHGGPVLLDLDETIYLRNSTEDFIDCARPALLALMLMRLLDALKPWRFTGGDSTRDVWRVRCILLFFPWTQGIWKKRVQALAEKFGNRPLIAAINRRAQTPQFQPAVITTLGFEPIVHPLVAALGLSKVRIVASRVETFADRREGKLRTVVNRLGHETVRRALVLTDSMDDEPLLDACAVPLRLQWREAHFRRAFSDRYLPGQYLTIVKRPGERYISRGILQEDFALWVLASVALATQPIAHIAALVCLLVSFWAIYEVGYVDNDRIAANFEDDPKLSRAFREAPVVTPRWTPWVWALGTGAIGVVLLRGVGMSAAYGFAAWTATLLGTYGTFHFYNRLDKSTRIWLYSVLQLARSAAIVTIVPIHLEGAMAIAAHVMAKWIPYYMYRVGGKNWPERSHFLTRLLCFLVLMVLLIASVGAHSVLTWSAGALLAWNVYRARTELLAAFLDAKRIDKNTAAEKRRVHTKTSEKAAHVSIPTSDKGPRDKTQVEPMEASGALAKHSTEPRLDRNEGCV